MWFTPLLQGAAALLQPPTSNTGAIVRKIPWTRQPQGAVEVDWSNPLTRGLVVETGGHRYYGTRLIDGTVNQSTNTGAGVSLAHTRYGKALSFNGSQANGAASFGDITRAEGLTSASWQVLFKHDSFNTENKIFAKWGTSNGSWLISTNSTGTGIAAWVVASTTSNANLTYFGASNVFEATGWNNAIFIWRGGTGTSNVSLFVNGVDKSSSLSALGTGASTMNSGDSSVQIGVANDGNPMIGQVAIARMWKRPLTLAEGRVLSLDPWGILKPVTRTIGAVISGVTIYRPTSDITTTGWTASTGSVLYDMIDEVIPSDIDYILSPDVNAAPGPATFGISSAPAGTYVISLRAMRTSSVGQIRALLKDSGGTTVGTSSWQTITGAFTTYNFSVTTTGTAAQLTIEVQP